ncbi:MAG: DUF3990 domain-containing protein [Chitinivibrionia bacterium]|nr:DUF3990 domain-containing protein [Chitinivibrionia bacterium]
MILYHGSSEKIIKVDLSRAVPGKDFGRGFYATNLREQAELWAKHKIDSEYLLDAQNIPHL